MAAKVLFVLALAVAAVMAENGPKEQEKRQIFGTAFYPGYAGAAYPYAYAAPAVAPVATTYAAPAVAPVATTYAAAAPAYTAYSAYSAYPYNGYSYGAYPYSAYGYAGRYAAPAVVY